MYHSAPWCGLPLAATCWASHISPPPSQGRPGFSSSPHSVASYSNDAHNLSSPQDPPTHSPPGSTLVSSRDQPCLLSLPWTSHHQAPVKEPQICPSRGPHLSGLNLQAWGHLDQYLIYPFSVKPCSKKNLSNDWLEKYAKNIYRFTCTCIMK